MTGEEAVERCLDALNAIGAKYMIVGSISSNFYGIPRSTNDADIVIEVAGDEIAQLRDRLAGVLRLDPQIAFETVGGTTRHLFRVDDSEFVIDVFELGPGPFDRERFNRRVPAKVGGAPTYLPTAEDVIVQKIRWRRGKDIDDARDVISVQHPNLDWPYILKWADEHGSRDVLDSMCQELGITPSG